MREEKYINDHPIGDMFHYTIIFKLHMYCSSSSSVWYIVDDFCFLVVALFQWWLNNDISCHDLIIFWSGMWSVFLYIFLETCFLDKCLSIDRIHFKSIYRNFTTHWYSLCPLTWAFLSVCSLDLNCQLPTCRNWSTCRIDQLTVPHKVVFPVRIFIFLVLN